MSIDWFAFVQVAGATWLAAIAIVTLFSTAVRLQALANDGGARAGVARLGMYACYAASLAAVLFGIYLIVPQFGGAPH
ncbi:hypothetical protein GCM10022377_05600 [Zhihengliuella alba]|uniref:Uncharacterized protein n=1 Tax=Zhihengliuella alba TaxID=547018 RepID=A0ABP7CWA0_9MICC